MEIKGLLAKAIKSNTEVENTYEGDSNGDQRSQRKLWLSSCGLKSLGALTTLRMTYSCFSTEIDMVMFYKQHMSQRFPGRTKHDINFAKTSSLTTPPNESPIKDSECARIKILSKCSQSADVKHENNMMMKMTLCWSRVQKGTVKMVQQWINPRWHVFEVSLVIKLHESLRLTSQTFFLNVSRSIYSN